MSLLLTLGLGGSGTPPTPPTGGDTPYMNLLLPTVSVTLGPLYATEVNNAFLRVDSHDHSDGFGHRVGTNGLNINSDLTFHGFNATNINDLGFNIQSPTAGLTGSLYFVGQDLWCADGAGNNFAITASGAVNVTGIGGWTGLVAPAQAGYDSVTKKFSLQSNTSPVTYGLLATGDILLYPGDPYLGSQPYIRLATPNSGVSTYTMSLPRAAPYSGIGTKQTLVSMDATGQLLLGPTAPSATSFLRMDNNGVPAADVILTGTTLQLTPVGGIQGLRVTPGGITNTELATGAIAPVKLQLNMTVSSPASLATSALTAQVVTSATLFGVSGQRSITISGRSLGGFPGFIVSEPSLSGVFGLVDVTQDGVSVYQILVPVQVVGIDAYMPANAVNCVLPPPSAGSHTYTVRIWVNSGTATITTNNLILTVQET